VLRAPRDVDHRDRDRHLARHHPDSRRLGRDHLNRRTVEVPMLPPGPEHLIQGQVIDCLELLP